MRDRFAFCIVVLAVVAMTSIIGMIGVFGASITDLKSDFLSGSGTIKRIVSATDGNRIVKLEVAKVSFSGRVGLDKNNNPSGNWHVRFVDVNNNVLDRAEFRSARIESLRLDDACGESVHFSALGRLNNELGWNLLVDASSANPVYGYEDNIRIRLQHPVYGEIYDSASEFESVDYCAGQALLESGNLIFK